MRKQAITFLSLFTLILVLSIYYLLVPPLEEENISVSNEQSSTIDILQNELDRSHENSISDNNDVIASSKSSEKEINSALSSINETKEIMKKEQDIVELLKKNGYKECYVEVNDTNIKVVVNLKNSSSKDANKIIKIIHQYLKNNYDIEVKFVTE
ncbi:MAG: SpoIIIAH-like family protein [Faecalibacillus sp.]